MSTVAAVLPALNPFVGPRPLEQGEPLFGRGRELQELGYKLRAERILLLHSPSGAGKSSLIQAGLLPRLRERFEIWGPLRVSGPSGAANPHLGALRAKLDELLPLAGPSAGPAATLSDLLVQRQPGNVLLVIDQFEEILTVDPLNEEAKRAFFAELGQLLRHPNVWALFALREEYLAQLDPYAREVPTNFRNRFRLGLLGHEAAREAIVLSRWQQPPGDDAVREILDDLATVQEQLPDGNMRNVVGKEIEPVQLQVVWRRLWGERGVFSPGAIRADVGEALEEFYATAVTMAAEGEFPLAIAIREFCGRRLITPGGIRGQVLHEAERSGGLPNRAIESLLESHLLRKEPRAGAVWYELAHDRLIQPVRQHNQRWLTRNLSDVQRRARQWADEHRPAYLLLQDEDLEAGIAWAAAQAITPLEEDFLAASRLAQRAADRERRFFKLAIFFALSALLLAGSALLQKKHAEDNRERADRIVALLFGERAAEAEAAAVEHSVFEADLRATDAMRAWIFSLAALDGSKDRLDPNAVARLLTPELQPRGRFAATRPARIELHGRPVAAVFTGSGRGAEAEMIVVERDEQGRRSLWRFAGRQRQRLARLEQPPSALAFDRRNQVLAIGFADGQVELQDWSAGWDKPPKVEKVPLSLRYDARITALAVQDGELAGGFWGTGILLAPSATGQGDGETNCCVTPPRTTIFSLAFRPDGTALANADQRGVLESWSRPGDRLEWRHALGASVSSLTYSPSGTWLAAALANGDVALRRAADGLDIADFPPGEELPVAVGFSADDRELLVLGERGELRVLPLVPHLFGREWDLRASLEEQRPTTTLVELHDTALEIAGFSDAADIGLRQRRRAVTASQGLYPPAATGVRTTPIAKVEHRWLDDRATIGPMAGYPRLGDNAALLIPDGHLASASVVFFEAELPEGDYEVEFEYLTHKHAEQVTSEDTADGVVLMLQKDPAPYRDGVAVPWGGARGFLRDGTGLGVHLQTFRRRGIFLEDGDGNALESVDGVQPDPYGGGAWRHLRVVVAGERVAVYYERQAKPLLVHQGLHRRFRGLALGAGTGWYSSEHRVRNVALRRAGEVDPAFSIEPGKVFTRGTGRPLDLPRVRGGEIVMMPDWRQWVASAFWVGRELPAEYSVHFQYLAWHHPESSPEESGHSLVVLLNGDRTAYDQHPPDQRPDDVSAARWNVVQTAIKPQAGAYTVHYEYGGRRAIVLRDPHGVELGRFDDFSSLPDVYGGDAWRTTRITVAPSRIRIAYEGQVVIDHVGELDIRHHDLGFLAMADFRTARQHLRDLEISTRVGH